MPILPNKVPTIRKLTMLQNTAAVVSHQAKVPVASLAGTSHLNASGLAPTSAPTLHVRSNQSKIAQ